MWLELVMSDDYGGVRHQGACVPTCRLGRATHGAAAAHRGNGYATEAARAAVAFGFQQRALPEIVSFTSVGNVRSQHVMERLGMRRDPTGDFDQPDVPEGHPVRPHGLYRFPEPSLGSCQ